MKPSELIPQAPKSPLEQVQTLIKSACNEVADMYETVSDDQKQVAHKIIISPRILQIEDGIQERYEKLKECSNQANSQLKSNELRTQIIEGVNYWKALILQKMKVSC